MVQQGKILKFILLRYNKILFSPCSETATHAQLIQYNPTSIGKTSQNTGKLEFIATII